MRRRAASYVAGVAGVAGLMLAAGNARGQPADNAPAPAPTPSPREMPAPPPDSSPKPPPDKPPDAPPKPIVEFRVHGSSKVTPRTLGYLAHVRVGDTITALQISQLETALMSSELFESAKVQLEDVPGGYAVTATLDDKLSWIAAPTVYVLPDNYAVGAGYAENDLFGQDRKLLLYGQIGNKSTLFFGTYLDPSVRGTHLQLRFDVYAYDIVRSDYVNDPSKPRSFDIARDVDEDFLDVGFLAGWQWRWWLVGDARVRAAYVFFRHAHTDDAPQVAAAVPEVDGYDTTAQVRITADHRKHDFGVTTGAYAQLVGEESIPGLSTYSYQDVAARAYYSWSFFGEQELELRSFFSIGRHLPFHEEFTNGGQSDLRGYDVDQFRGDTQVVLRAEYSVPIWKWRMFAFRALGFYDSGYIGFHFRDPSGMRDYLPTEANGAYWIRNDVGGGLRVYVKSVVLPLVGVDFGYGLEGHSPEVYFELGLTDF